MSYNIALFTVIVSVTLIMIGRSTPDPHSMKTTPGLADCVGQMSHASSAVFIEGGGHNHPIKNVPKTVIVQSLQVPALEWEDLLGLLPEEVCN